ERRAVPAPGAAGELRFKAATHDIYEGGAWRKTRSRGPPVREQGGRFRLAGGAPPPRAKDYLPPPHSPSPPPPVPAARPEAAAGGGGGATVAPARGGAGWGDPPPGGGRGRGGGGRVGRARPGAPPQPEVAGEPTLDLSGLTPRMTELAKRVMGEGPPGERA